MPGATMYDRMEDEILGRNVRRSLLLRLLEAALIVLFFFLFGYLFYSAQFSGTVRWFLSFVFIGGLAAYAWWYVARRTSEPAPLVAAPPRPRLVTGELWMLTSMVQRANGGLTYSQMAVSTRARDAFAERTRLARGMSPAAMRALEHDAWGLQTAYRDPVLVDFLYLRAQDTEERYRWVRDTQVRGGFPASLGAVLDRMEAWR